MVTRGPFPALLRELGEDAWPWLVGGGVTLMLLGAIGLGAALLATIVTVVAFGLILLAGGIVQVLQALRLPTWGGVFLYLIAGLLTAVAGLIMLARPLEAAFPLTFVLAVYLVALGGFRVFVAFTRAVPARGWAIAGGIASIVLGLMIGAEWPVSGLWALGLLVSVDLLLTGIAHLQLGLMVRRLTLGGARPGVAGGPAPAT